MWSFRTESPPRNRAFRLRPNAPFLQPRALGGIPLNTTERTLHAPRGWGWLLLGRSCRLLAFPVPRSRWFRFPFLLVRVRCCFGSPRVAVVSFVLYVCSRLVLVLAPRVLAFVLVVCGGFISPFASFMGHEAAAIPSPAATKIYFPDKCDILRPRNGSVFQRSGKHFASPWLKR